jgi:hypothetical protein
LTKRFTPPWLGSAEFIKSDYSAGKLSSEEFDRWYESIKQGDGKTYYPKARGKKPEGVTVPCFLCGEPFNRQRISGHYCRACRESVRKRKDAANKRRKRDELKEALPKVVKEIRPELFVLVNKLAEQEARKKVGLVPDRMPEGSSSSYGSDDGRSTYDKELSEDLDRLSWYSACHRWWIDNPHWNIGLYGG